jgi:serine/threonine protein phosphatase PrpC
LKEHPTIGCYSLDGKRFNGEANINQDAYTIIEEFYEITPKSGQFSRLMLLADGHGPEGHLISWHVIQIFPQILAKHLNS